MEQAGAQRPQDLDFRALTRLARRYLEIFETLNGCPFPQDPLTQLQRATEAVFDSWMSPRAIEYRRMRRIDAKMGTAVTVQRMVFGNAGGTSGAGVGFSRDPASGENRLYLDFRFNSQGEDVVSGQHSAPDTARLAASLPHVLSRLESMAEILEREFGDVQEFEFTVQDGVLYLLQTRSAKRTPWAALRIAVEQVNAGIWSPARALDMLGDVDLRHMEHARIGDTHGHTLLGSAIPAGIGVAVGVIALDPADACAQAEAGQDCILVRDDTSTADLRGIAAARGILTARGGRTAHAAVVARQLGKACLVGCTALRIDLARRCVTIGEHCLHEGDTLTLDCASGHIYAGAVPVITNARTRGSARSPPGSATPPRQAEGPSHRSGRRRTSRRSGRITRMRRRPSRTTTGEVVVRDGQRISRQLIVTAAVPAGMRAVTVRAIRPEAGAVLPTSRFRALNWHTISVAVRVTTP
jgi:pyruvate,orthophosphate dikinase